MLSDLLLRLRALFTGRAVEREIDEELRFHLDRQIEAYEQRGLSHADAVRQTRLEFGGIDQVKEEYRDALGIRLLDELRRDLGLAVRVLRATPVVTAVAILSLALAIGANTAIFSIVNSLMLRTLPVHEPDRLALVTDQSTAPRVRVWNYPVWEQIRQRSHLFDSSAAWSFMRFNLADGGEAEFVEGLWVSGSFFETLGVHAVLGRVLDDRDDQPGGGPNGPVAVISSRYWQRHFGGHADIIGRSVRLNRVTFTIVGVTTAEFSGPEVGRTVDLIVPLRTEPLVRPADSFVESCCTNFLSIIGRLKSGQSHDRASVELRGVQAEIREATLGSWSAGAARDVVDRYLTSPLMSVPAATSYSNLRERYERPLLILAIVVALVLFIGCANVANLLLARAIGRRHELGVRQALGASRGRLVRQLFAESAVLAGAGAALGVLIAAYTSRFLVRQFSTPAAEVFLDLSFDVRVIAFTIALGVLTSLFFGTAPAFRAARTSPMDALTGLGRTSSPPANQGLMSWLVVVQVALSVVLITAAGVFIRSFASLAARPLGFAPDRVLVVTIDAQRAIGDPAERVRLYERVRESVLALPNVAGAAISHLTPVGGGGFTPSIEVAGDARMQAMPQLVPANGDVFGNLISPGWFSTFGIGLVAGRDFSDADFIGAPRVGIVNEAFVRRLLGGAGAPLGRRFTLYPNAPGALGPIEIVGIAADAVYTSPHEPPPPAWYVPFGQFDRRGFSFATARLSVRSATGPPDLLIKGVAAAIGTVNPQLSLTFRPLADQVHGSLRQQRLMAWLAGFFGVLALLLAALGVYGVTAYAISRRRAEIGIRIALGATPKRIIALVVARTGFFMAIGVTAGLTICFWSATLVEDLVYDLPARDLATLAGSALVLVAIGVAASWMPVRRAARIDPIRVLRES